MTNETQATVGYTLWAVFARPIGRHPRRRRRITAVRRDR